MKPQRKQIRLQWLAMTGAPHISQFNDSRSSGSLRA